MAATDKMDWCAKCECERLFRRHEPDHWIHIVLMIVTGGWWLPVWLCAMAFRGPFRCMHCGQSERAQFLPAPTRSAWSLPLLTLTLGLLIGGVGAGRWFGREKRPKHVHEPPPKSLVTQSTSTHEDNAIPAVIDAEDLQRAFARSSHRAEARFGQKRLTVKGWVRYSRPARPGGQAWLVFVNQNDEPLAQCLVPEEAQERFEARFGEIATEATLRCDFLRYSSDGSLTLFRPELVVD
jgi:hypothetical protein